MEHQPSKPSKKEIERRIYSKGHFLRTTWSRPRDDWKGPSDLGYVEQWSFDVAQRDVGDPRVFSRRISGETSKGS